jgi:hypothetical protein
VWIATLVRAEPATKATLTVAGKLLTAARILADVTLLLLSDIRKILRAFLPMKFAMDLSCNRLLPAKGVTSLPEDRSGVFGKMG